jgi:hypothetical protein
MTSHGIPSMAYLAAQDTAVASEAAAAARIVRRVNIVGRIMLWSATLFLALAGLASVANLAWFVPPLHRQAWFLPAYLSVVAAAALAFVTLAVVMFVIYDLYVPPRSFMNKPLDGAKVHVGITSYNDREAIIATVREFKRCPQVTRVCVADNNSKDGSFQAAQDAGADSVVHEAIPGYGSCCMAALAEAARGLDPDDVVILCEGDMTFSAGDVRKFLAYLEHCDMVVGTRTTQELRESDTQMDWLINPGNQLMAKLTQVRFWEVRLTDVGCTYRALRVGAYHRLREVCHDRGMMFDYQMVLESLRQRMRVIEVPVVFRQRVGESKGVGANKIKAVKATLALLRMLYKA